MNTLIQTLNDWGENFLNFAWPMLWQSSPLIALVFAFDVLFARRIRAAVRYALWLTVLVKLLLPPALALPTGVAWWLWPAKPPLTPVVNTQVVTFDTPVSSQPVSIPQAIPFVPPPPPELSSLGWIMLSCFMVGAALLLWLAFRWLRVSATVRHATVSGEFDPLLKEACPILRLRHCPRLKLVDDVQSPAVYGLFRPVILLPRTLAEKLSACQLRAVLLHEAIHLRRGDVWAHCAQTLLQIAYWWHPLLWLANTRIRRLREEAVDDAVMLALRGDADAYAPTLLEVAKFSFRRPLSALALVGILESRSALRRRIERLVDFRPPRRAGLTFQALCGILLFCAVALPMGCGRQAPKTDSFSPDAGSTEKTLTVKVDPQVFARNVAAQANWTLERDTNEILLDIMESEGVDCTPPHDIAFNTKTGEITAQNTPEQLEIFQLVVDELNRADGKCAFPLQSTPFHRKSVLIQGQFFWMTPEDIKKITVDAAYHRRQGDYAAHWTVDAKQFGEMEKRIKRFGLKPFTQPRIQTGHGITAEIYMGNPTNWVDFECNPYVYDDSIGLAFKAESDSVSMQDAVAITNRYEVDGKESLDNNGGIIVTTKKGNDSPTNLVVVIRVKTVAETSAARNASETGHYNEAEAELNQALVVDPKNPAVQYSSALALEAITNRSQPPSGTEINPVTGLPMPVSPAATTRPSPGRQMIYNYHLGVLFVYATPQDLDVVEKALEALYQKPPSVNEDRAGNRVHSEEEMPFAQNEVPPPWPSSQPSNYPHLQTHIVNVDDPSHPLNDTLPYQAPDPIP